MSKTIHKILAISATSLLLLSGCSFLNARIQNSTLKSASNLEELTVEEQEVQDSRTTVAEVESTEVTEQEVTEPKAEIPTEELPKLEEVVMPEIKVDGSMLEDTTPTAEAPVSTPEIKVDGSMLEATTPKVGVQFPKIRVDGSILGAITPKVKAQFPKFRVDGSMLEAITPKVKAQFPEIKVDGSMLEDTTPTAEAPGIKVDGSMLEDTTPTVEVDEEQTVEQLEKTLAQESNKGSLLANGLLPSDEAEKYKDKITTMTSKPTDKTITVISRGDYNKIHFAIFKCDLGECVGFKDGVSEFYEGRRGKNQNCGGYWIQVDAPQAREGYIFDKWVKLGVTLIGSENNAVACDVYKPTFYKKVIDIESVTESTDPLNEEITEIPDSIENSLDEDSNTNTPKHECDIPERNRCTTSKSSLNSKKLTIVFNGCCHYVSTVRFKCDLDKCDGFVRERNCRFTSDLKKKNLSKNGSIGKGMVELTRRGESKIRVTAPKAKSGFKFVRWEKTTKFEINASHYRYPVDVYTAIYEPENE